MELSYRRFVWLCRHVSGLLILCLIGVLFVNIVAREVFSLAFPWANEVALALFVWVAFLGAGVSFAENVRIRFDFVVDRFPAPARHGVEVLLHYVGLAMLVGMTLTGVYVAYVYRAQTFTTLPASIVWQLAAVPIGSSVAVLGWSRHGTWWRARGTRSLTQTA